MQRYVLIPKSQREGRSSFTGKEEIISPVLPHSWLHPYRESGAPFVSYPLTALYRKEFPLHSTCLSKLPSQESHRFHYQSTDGNRYCVRYVFRLYRKPHHSAPDTIIRKTKCSPLFKRSDISYKTKRPPKNNFPKYSRGSKKSTGKFCFSQCFFL